ncbi:YveK family protein [Clostridium paraputrificum]|uniref:YveK family protein n=1 Tax=Clostridium TaxID=1485 RepID=UPI003D352C31
MEKNTISLAELMSALKKRIALIVVIIVAFTGVFGLVSLKTEDPTYTANSKIFFGKDVSGGSSYDKDDITFYVNIIKTYAEVIKTDDFLKNALKKVDLEDQFDDVKGNVLIEQYESTQVVNITYTGKNAEDSAKVVEGVIEELKETSKTLIPIDNLTVIEDVKTEGNYKEVNRAVYLAIGFVLGTVIAILLALMLEFMKVKKAK